MGKYLCHCFLYSPDAISKEVLTVAWARSRTPIVCACFVVACFKFMPNILATSCITSETKKHPLPVIMSAGKLACLVIMSLMTVAVFTAVGLETGCTIAYLENTTIAVMIFS